MSLIWLNLIHHEDVRCLRYGRVLRRPTLAHFRGTSRANWRPQPWLRSVINLAKSEGVIVNLSALEARCHVLTAVIFHVLGKVHTESTA